MSTSRSVKPTPLSEFGSGPDDSVLKLKMEEKRTILSVSELNRKARLTLENGIGEVWVEGEISRLTRHSSGHWYFTLKDEAAAISCAMFKQNNLSVLFKPEDGLKVRVLGQTSLYEARGNYQLLARQRAEDVYDWSGIVENFLELFRLSVAS